MPPFRSPPMTEKPNVLSWLGSTVRNLLDKASEEMVAPHVTWMEAEVNRLRHGFDFAQAATARRLDKADRCRDESAGCGRGVQAVTRKSLR